MTNNLNFITDKLLKWYKSNHRPLPWRETRDPYKIWLSEIILQQTRVNQGLPYYEKFVENYPSVKDLAQASEQEVLRLWQGLGYYSRARNLHRCAKLLVEKYNSEFPKEYTEVRKLPGIGPYTAAAIASFAFKEVVPAIDGNVFRVLSRLFGVESNILASSSRKEFEILGQELISKTQPDNFNQAMMEFGALQCVPKNPDCNSCPLAIECYARQQGLQHKFPVKVKNLKVRKRHFNYLVFRVGEHLWLRERPKGDIWQGLFDFKLLENDNNSDLSEKLIADEVSSLSIPTEVRAIEVSTTYKHVLTHQIIYAKFYTVDLGLKSDDLNNKDGFYSLSEVKDLPKPVLVSRYLNEVIF
ncbi:MAG: A/G-specific adenine glycosylase [Fulvivirga sp.]